MKVPTPHGHRSPSVTYIVSKFFYGSESSVFCSYKFSHINPHAVLLAGSRARARRCPVSDRRRARAPAGRVFWSPHIWPIYIPCIFFWTLDAGVLRSWIIPPPLPCPFQARPASPPFFCVRPRRVVAHAQQLFFLTRTHASSTSRASTGSRRQQHSHSHPATAPQHTRTQRTQHPQRRAHRRRRRRHKQANTLLYI